MKIIAKAGNQTVQYAALELLKYIRRMSDCSMMPILEITDTLPAIPTADAIVLGLLDELGLDSSDLKDPFMEDILDISITGTTGYLAGSNPRSILMAVYQYCKSAGCRFLRPEPEGEYVPTCDLTQHSFTYRKKADYPFRGECCEGAISYEHMRNTVYWLPKVGMNMYMIEGIVPYSYMHRWYGHIGNRILREPKQETDLHLLEDYIARLEQDIVKTGIQLHAVGHGWMFNKLGFEDRTPEAERAAFERLSDEQKGFFAMVNGKRDIFHRSTFYTHYCYSNPRARQALVDFCVEYVQKKPYIDYLHVWLADNVNNQCECDECVKKTPSDWYAILLNEIDEALEKLNAKTRLVFIAYTDTVRPPEREKLNHPERFVLLTAIGSFYETGYLLPPYEGEIPPYVRNKSVTPPNALRLKWYRDWKKMCGNIPGVIFEYRFYTDHYSDPGHMNVARETHRDMQQLAQAGFQGCMSDLTHRLYVPTSLPMLLMGETLFDSSLDFETYVNDYFAAAFGEDGALCREFTEALSDLFCQRNLRASFKNTVEDTGINSNLLSGPIFGNTAVAEKVEKIPSLIRDFLPVIERNLTLKDACRRRSWFYLYHYTDVCLKLAEVVRLAALREDDAARAALEELEILVCKQEEFMHPVFDLYLFIRTFRGLLKIKMDGYFE